MRQRYLFLYFLILTPFLSKANPTYNSLEYIENRGQWDGPFVYKTTTSGSDVFLRKDGFTFLIAASSNSYKVHERKHGRLQGKQVLSYHAYKLTFENALQPVISGSKEQSYYYNYFIGSDPSKWKSGIHPALAVDYGHLYAGIDMHIASEHGQLKYEFIVAPGADAAQIKMKYEGTDGMEIRDGNLVVKTSVGDVTEMKPYVYQYINGVRKEVACKYKLSNNTISFSFPKGYDGTTNLVIDPTVVFSTFTGSTADNWGFTATYDDQGNFYAGGFAHSAGYPLSNGAFQTTFAGGSTTTNSFYECDIAITKFDPTGTQKLYSTYLGGSDNEQPHSLVVDGAGNLVVAGRTYSSDYPFTPGAYKTANQGNCDIVVTKFNNGGTNLIGSTYVGGTGDDGVNFNSDEFTFGNLKHNYGDDARSEVILDNTGNIYIAACTQSTNFPIVNASQGLSGGAQDAVVFKLNPNLTQMIWSTYLGGINDDAAYVLALNKAQTQLYVAGGTSSPNFPTTGGTFRPGYQGGSADGFIVRYTNGGAYTRDLITFIGQTNYDQCYGIQVDNDDNVYAMGQTIGGGFPIQVAPTAATIYSNPGGSQFIIKLNSGLATNIYSTVFGAGNASHIDISPVAFLVDTCQNVYISGWGGTLGIANNGSSTTNLPVNLNQVPPGSPLTSTTDGSDFYFFVLSKNGIALLFAGFYGRSSTDLGKGEHVDGGTSRFDKNGRIYQAICGGCVGNPGIPASPFPTTIGSTSPGSTNCNLAALKIEFNLGAVAAEAKAEPNAVLCLGESITFSNTSANAVSYEWDFGDNSPIDNQKIPTPHTYASIGKYTVRMIALNPNACKVRDTVFLEITVDTNTIKAGFNAIKIDSCGPYTAQMVNTSKYSKTPASTTFQWDFGDGKTATGAIPPTHNYNDTGTYTITLIMTDTTACNSPDTITRKVHYSNILVAGAFEAPDACERTEISFGNGSKNALTYLWNFGDKDTSTQQNPKHTYDTAGQYTVKMLAYNPETCNKVDSVIKVINVKPTPVAEFDYSPIPSQRNKETVFSNKSSGATAGYLWDFGDKTGSEETNPIHLYKRTGDYTVCLVAKNTEGCADTACKTVEAIIQPLAELPTGFSPNGDGKNDVFYVRGAGVEKFNMKIFNRWGQLIFEVTDGQANDPKYGWDGSYKGKQQEMEAYAWVLSGSFTDETTFYKKGNVTLLR